MSATTTLRYERFAREYVIDRNGTRAYKAAGYKATSDNAAAVGASKLLRKANVREIVERLEREVAERLEVTKEKIDRELASIAFVDLRDFYDEHGNMKPVQQWTREMAAAVQSIEVFEEYQGQGAQRQYIGRTKKIKLWPKLEANALLGARFGIGVKKIEIGKSNDDPGDTDLAALRRRIIERAARLGFKMIPVGPPATEFK